MKHVHKWIGTLVDRLDTDLDEGTRARVLEACGRTCIPRSFVNKAKKCRDQAKDTDEFLDKLGKMWSHLHRTGDDVYVVYEKCYCPLVKDYPGELSSTWCNCSRGWAKELFEAALEGPVDVELLQSIRQGDEVCKLAVHFPE